MEYDTFHCKHYVLVETQRKTLLNAKMNFFNSTEVLMFNLSRIHGLKDQNSQIEKLKNVKLSNCSLF